MGRFVMPIFELGELRWAARMAAMEGTMSGWWDEDGVRFDSGGGRGWGDTSTRPHRPDRLMRTVYRRGAGDADVAKKWRMHGIR